MDLENINQISTCDKVHSYPEDVNSKNLKSYHFESSTCFCDKMSLCRFSYSKPDLEKCSIREIEWVSGESLSNCDMVNKCYKDSNDCDGIFFDGTKYFTVSCANDNHVPIIHGKGSEFVIQLENCF